jgi:hypothetical protein
MSKSIDPSDGMALGEAVRTAEEVTEGSIGDAVITTIQYNLDDSHKSRIFELYDEGEIAEKVARRLIGNEDFEDAVEKARGAEMMLSGDSSRFISEK